MVCSRVCEKSEVLVGKYSSSCATNGSLAFVARTAIGDGKPAPTANGPAGDDPLLLGEYSEKQENGGRLKGVTPAPGA